MTDGPAAEIKEVFGGLTLVECDGLDEALKWAARLPTASDGAVEVRPFYQVSTRQAAAEVTTWRWQSRPMAVEACLAAPAPGWPHHGSDRRLPQGPGPAIAQA